MRRVDSALANGAVSEMAFQRRATALGAYLEGCGVASFRRRILESKLWSDATGLESGQPRRLVEQQQRIPGKRSGIFHFFAGSFFLMSVN